MGVKRIITDRSSNLPVNIPIIKTHLVVSDNPANVLVGPITLPNPGPTFANDVAAPDSEVKKSFPTNDKIKVIKTTKNILFFRRKIFIYDKIFNYIPIRIF